MRWVSRGGRWSIGRLKYLYSDIIACDTEGKERWVKDEGRWSIGWLK